MNSPTPLCATDEDGWGMCTHCEAPVPTDVRPAEDGEDIEDIVLADLTWHNPGCRYVAEQEVTR